MQNLGCCTDLQMTATTEQSFRKTYEEYIHADSSQTIS